MKTISLKIPEGLDSRLEDLARSRRVSRSKLVRELLTSALAEAEDAQMPSAYDMMRHGFGVVRSGIPDLATGEEHMEGYGR